MVREQLRVNNKDDCGGRLFPTITKLMTWGELIGEEARDRCRGERDTEDNTIDKSFTDHRTSPLDPMSTLPKILSFDEGFILDPDKTSNLTTGDREARMVIRKTFSQPLTSPSNVDLPLMMIWNTSPTATEEEFGVTTKFDEEEEEKVREPQESRDEPRI